MRPDAKRVARPAFFDSFSPKTTYIPVLEGIDGSSLSWSEQLHSTHGLPILAFDDRLSSNNLDSAAFTETSEPYIHRPKTPGPFQRASRSWSVLRWKLSRNVFSVPLPLLTKEADLKLGDLLITLPMITAAIVYTSLQAKNGDVAATGTHVSIAMAFVFGFAVRNNSILLLLTGIPFDRALFYHKLVAFVTIFLAALHALAYQWGARKVEQRRTDSKVATGLAALIGLALMYLLSLNFIRRKFFQFFIQMHWVLFIAIIVCAFRHGAQFVTIGIAPWALDLMYRLLYRSRIYARGTMNKATKGVIARDQLLISAMPGNITRIQFPRVRPDTGESFDYKAGQYAFLCVPSISHFQWHPFTISSSPHEPFVTFHIKALGDWTTKLLTAALKREASSMRLEGPSTFDVLVDGPYGSISIDMESPLIYSHFVMIAGGIGVTPMRSIVNWLHHECYYRNRGVIPQVRLVWSAKDMETIASLLARDQPGRDSCHEVDEVASYLPHILLHPRNPNAPADAFFSEIYLTRDILDEEAQDLPELANCLHLDSRPDTIAILREVGEDVKNSGKNRIGVLVCGPTELVDDVLYASIRLGRELKVHFDVHREQFEL